MERRQRTAVWWTVAIVLVLEALRVWTAKQPWF